MYCPEASLRRMSVGRFLPIGAINGARGGFRLLFGQFGFPVVKSNYRGATIAPEPVPATWFQK
jgi:hypothetical protein